MLRIDFTEKRYDRDRGEWTETSVATFEMDGTEVRCVAGDETAVHPHDIRLINRDGHLLNIQHGEEWGRLLPQAYQHGRLTVTVTELDAAARA